MRQMFPNNSPARRPKHVSNKQNIHIEKAIAFRQSLSWETLAALWRIRSGVSQPAVLARPTRMRLAMCKTLP
jgi:hypothetical protein